MTHVYFHCSNRNELLVDRCGTVVDDLAEARDHAACVVRSLTTARSLEDWRGWILHVNDDLGDELFVVPLFFRAGQAALKAGLFASKRQQSGSPKVSVIPAARDARSVMAGSVSCNLK
jgi:hypothetical protein